MASASAALAAATTCSAVRPVLLCTGCGGAMAAGDGGDAAAEAELAVTMRGVATTGISAGEAEAAAEAVAAEDAEGAEGCGGSSTLTARLRVRGLEAGAATTTAAAPSCEGVAGTTAMGVLGTVQSLSPPPPGIPPPPPILGCCEWWPAPAAPAAPPALLWGCGWWEWWECALAIVSLSRALIRFHSSLRLAAANLCLSVSVLSMSTATSATAKGVYTASRVAKDGVVMAHGSSVGAYCARNDSSSNSKK